MFCWCFLLFLALCGAILFLSSLGRSPWNFDMHLDIVGPKIGGVPEKNFWADCFFSHLGPKSPSSLDRSAWNFAKWWEIGGSLKVRSKNVNAPEKKLGEAKVRLGRQFRGWNSAPSDVTWHEHNRIILYTTSAVLILGGLTITCASITFSLVDRSSPSFFSSKVGGVVVRHLFFRFLIFAIKVLSCLKLRRIFHSFAL